MLTPDPKNKDESYRYAVETCNHYILKQDFEYFYDDKLEAFSSKLDDIIDSLSSTSTAHPDKKLAKFDSQTLKLMEKVYAFFEEKVAYYGESIWSVYQKDFYDYLNQERQNYLDNDYQDELEVYRENEEEKTRIKKLSSKITKIIKTSSPIKQADVLKQFSKEEQSAAKRIIQNLLKKGVILRGETDIGKKTAWILVYVE